MKMEGMRGSVAAWWRGAVAAALAGLLFLPACAGVPVSDIATPQVERPAKSDAEVLRERAQAYWQARVKDDMATAYTFEDPVRRKTYSLVPYIRTVGGGMKFTSADVTEVKIDGDQADVFVQIHGRHMLPGWDTIPNLKRTQIDDWQKIDGQWVHVLDFHLFRAGKPRVNPDGTVKYHQPGRAAGQGGQ